MTADALRSAKGVSVVGVGLERVFGERVAVSAIDVSFDPGRVHAVVGQNGAGKSTLLHVLAGVIPPTRGVVRVGGVPLAPHTLARAVELGVGIVHQHFMLVPGLTGLENLALGAEPTTGLWKRLDLRALRASAEALSAELGLAVPLEVPVTALSVGQRQRLEIVRVLLRGAKALLLDEPTAILAPSEVGRLFGVLRRLADEGRTVVVVTHRPAEVSRFCDSVTVLRGGVRVDAPAPLPSEARERAVEREAFEAALVRAMMGDDVARATRPIDPPSEGDVVVRVRHLRVKPGVEGGLSFAVREGEVVGVAGIEGSGQEELVRALSGLGTEEACASVEFPGVSLAEASVSGPSSVVKRVRARRPFVAVVHGDRHRAGVVLDATLHDNLVLGQLAPASRAESERAMAAERVEEFGVEPAEPTLPMRFLSGGNQQKAVVARAVHRLRSASGPRLLVALHPTRGVDVSAAARVRRAMVRAAEAGAAVIVASSDLEELREIAHRILVVREGVVVAELSRQASDDEIGRAMLGSAENAHALGASA